MLAPRWLFALGALTCVILFGVALYMQHVMHLEPCPLCAVQRVFVIVLALVMASAAIHNPRGMGRRAYGASVAVIALLGAAVAARHVYLQNLPADRVPECGPGLEYILDAFPIAEALALILKGSGECAEVQWTFLGLTIPGWTLIAFLGIAGIGAFSCMSRGFASPRASSSAKSTDDQ